MSSGTATRVGEGAARILVVDDDRRVVELLEFALGSHGYRTLTAADGEEALRRVTEERPDLVVLDVRLPKKSGLEVCERLRRDPADGQIPIIMVSAAGETEARVQALHRGADDYLSKPFSPKELIARIQRLLARSADGRAALARSRELERELGRAQDEVRRAHHDIGRERRLRELAFGTGGAFQRRLDAEGIARGVLDAAASRLGVASAAVLIAAEGGGPAEAFAVAGPAGERLGGLEIEERSEMARLVAGLGRPVLRRELESRPETRDAVKALIECGALALLALASEDGTEGWLVIGERHRGGALEGQEREWLAALGGLAGAALRNARRVYEHERRMIDVLVARAGEVDAHATDAARVASRAARALGLAASWRRVIPLAIRLGAWSETSEGSHALGQLVPADPFALLPRLASLVELAEPETARREAADPHEMRAARLVALGLAAARARGEGASLPTALQDAVERATGLDARTREAWLAAAREAGLMGPPSDRAA